MSEWLKKDDPHMENLRLYCKGVLEEDDLGALYREYESDIMSVKPDEVMALVDWMVACGEYSMETVKDALNRIINIFSSHLEDDAFDLSGNVSKFISVMAQENDAVTEHMEKIKEKLKLFSKSEAGSVYHNSLKGGVKKLIEELAGIENHYVKKENILFPYVEKHIPEYRCLHVMWSIHDDVRRGIKTLSGILSEDPMDEIKFNRAIGRLFFDIYGMIFRENYILLPMSVMRIPESDLKEMASQCSEIGYSFIEAPEMEAEAESTAGMSGGMVDLGTGEMSVQELIAMLNHLPVDITFVDGDDRVRYFSSPKERIFPRSKAIIGRSVQNCHPHESVHIVNEVVKRLKSGEKDVENFWIQMQGKFILIQYFAVRADGKYLGTMEVSQEVTDIRALSGEKRLLDSK